MGTFSNVGSLLNKLKYNCRQNNDDAIVVESSLVIVFVFVFVLPLPLTLRDDFLLMILLRLLL